MHFPNLPPDVRARLEERGIDPDELVQHFVEQIRHGTYAPTFQEVLDDIEQERAKYRPRQSRRRPKI